MRLPDSAHTSRPWRIHEIAPDFRLEDVWALPTPGAREEFPLLIEGFTEADPLQHPSRVVRTLFDLRWRLGELFGWDDESTGVGSRVQTLRDRIPADLRDRPGPEFDALPFTSLYLLDDEWVAESANQTMHGLLHLGWVPDDATGGYRGQMAILVKPNGRFGSAYMAAIKPFRHLLVYPALMRQIERQWREREAAPNRVAA